MNRSIWIFFAIFFLQFTSNAQFEWGLKAGISSYQLGEKSLTEWVGEDEFQLHFTEADYGHHFGLYSRLQVAGVYLEPSVLFNSGSFSYTFEDYSEAGVVTVVRNERYNHVNIPLLLGLKVGFFRIQAGPVGSFFISKTSDLWDFEGYQQKFETFTYGLQGGLGLDIWRFRFDVNYENNLNTLGNHVTIGGKKFPLNPNPARIIFTLGYKF
ncbi:MAG: outer membrane beta-barrel protein [Saprospiraceae bacterium]